MALRVVAALLVLHVAASAASQHAHLHAHEDEDCSVCAACGAAAEGDVDQRASLPLPVAETFHPLPALRPATTQALWLPSAPRAPPLSR